MFIFFLTSAKLKTSSETPPQFAKYMYVLLFISYIRLPTGMKLHHCKVK